VRRQPGVVIPIVGSTTAAQLQDSLACLEFELSDAHLTRLNHAIELGYPHDFLTDPFSLKLIHGEHAADIDKHHAT
jgi:diketogulonate reductase-like aldo/keto reductase